MVVHDLVACQVPQDRAVVLAAALACPKDAFAVAFAGWEIPGEIDQVLCSAYHLASPYAAACSSYPESSEIAAAYSVLVCS